MGKDFSRRGSNGCLSHYGTTSLNCGTPATISCARHRSEPPHGSQWAPTVARALIDALSQLPTAAEEPSTPPAAAAVSTDAGQSDANTPTDPSLWVQPEAPSPADGQRTPTNPAEWIAVRRRPRGQQFTFLIVSSTCCVASSMLCCHKQAVLLAASEKPPSDIY